MNYGVYKTRRLRRKSETNRSPIEPDCSQYPEHLSGQPAVSVRVAPQIQILLQAGVEGDSRGKHCIRHVQVEIILS